MYRDFFYDFVALVAGPRMLENQSPLVFTRSAVRV